MLTTNINGIIDFDRILVQEEAFTSVKNKLRDPKETQGILLAKKTCQKHLFYIINNAEKNFGRDQKLIHEKNKFPKKSEGDACKQLLYQSL